MAHIIAFMDDTIHAGTRPSFRKGPQETKRQLSVHQLRRVVHSPPAVPSGDPKAESVRMDRVHALRAAIADGSYAVSASDLAEKILRGMLQK